MLGLTALLYVALYVSLDQLQFAPTRDERHFWRTAQQFAAEFPPPIALLRTYNELNTPLPFVVFGTVERFTHGGIAAGRLVNLIVSFAIVVLIIVDGLQRAGGSQQRIGRVALACAGLLVFPYFLGTSIMLYTDIIPAALVLGGMVLHARDKTWLAMIMFVLAISSRQYAVAFPIALAIYELAKSFFATQTDQGQKQRGISPWLAPRLAAASLLGWIAFFGGLAPQNAIEKQSLATADAFRVFPAHALSFFACIGAYFVIPETILFRRIKPLLSALRQPRALPIAGVIILAFIFWPPLRNVDYGVPTMGYLDKAARLALGDGPRMVLFAALALLAAVRFSKFDLATLLVWTNALLMMKAHIGWDKYALPLLIVLWWMKAIDAHNTTALPTATPQPLPCPHDEAPALQRDRLVPAYLHSNRAQSDRSAPAATRLSCHAPLG